MSGRMSLISVVSIFLLIIGSGKAAPKPWLQNMPQLQQMSQGANMGWLQHMAQGADVSWLQQMEATGFVFRDRDGNVADCLKILKDHGIDTIRLRVWVNPSDDPINGHCSPAEVIQMAKRASRIGFRILIDFHYSDSWADPGSQKKPEKWADHDFSQLKKDVYAHTKNVLMSLKYQGVFPEWVQIGNEITSGMLWPEGHISEHPAQLAELINAGYRATKKVDRRIRVIVHIDRGNIGGVSRWFFDILQEHGALYDVIGLSYYPYWLANQKDYRLTIDDLGKNLIDVSERYNKEVMIVETGGLVSQPEDTRQMLAAVIEKVRSVPNGKGIGVIYWEPEGARSWSGYPLNCWGDDGRPTEVLQAFLESRQSQNYWSI